MSKEKDKPRGVLEGVAKAFVGLPHSFVLTTPEQGVREQVRGNELVRQETTAITTQGERAQLAAQRAFFEIQSMRVASQDAVRAAGDIRREVAVSNEQLSRIGDTLEEGLPTITQGLGELNTTMRQVGGLPETQKNIVELIRNGTVVESEAIILALGEGLRPQEKHAFLKTLEPWKKDIIIKSGLISNHDAKMENTLTPEKKVFLRELRRCASDSIRSFRSLEALSRYHLLQEDLQHYLSKTERVVRTGLGGVVHGLNEIATQGDTTIAQGAENLQLQRSHIAQRNVQIGQGATLINQGAIRINQAEVLEKLTREGVLIGKSTLDETKGVRIGVDKLVDFEHLAQLDRRAIRRAGEETAENTMAIARGVAAQICLLQRQGQSLDRISEATEGTYRNTGLLAVFAERANEIAKANLEANAATAHNTGLIVDGVENLAEIGIAGLESAQITAHNSGIIAEGIGNLEGFAERAEFARAVMVEQFHGMTRLLEDIADGIDTGNYYQALTREAIADAHLTLIQGFSAAAKIGVAKLETSMRTNDLLADLLETQAAQHAEIVGALGKIESGMEKRHITQNQARAHERYKEGLGKYKKGKIDEAIVLLNKSLKFWSNEYRVYFLRGICYALRDQPQEAEADFNEALVWVDENNNAEKARIKQNLARLYYSESRVHFERGNSELSDEKMLAAITTAKDATRDDPQSADAAFALATYLAAFKLYDEARKILMDIIPKDPSLLVKMLYVPEFALLFGSFKHTFKEETVGKISIAIIKDCIAIGDISTALTCIRDLINSNPINLLRLKVWSIEELQPIRENMVAMLKETIANPQKGQHGYAIAMLALHLRTSKDEISDFEVFDAFIKGTNGDIDVDARNKTAMIKKLTALSSEKVGELLLINRLHTKGIGWLN